MAGVEMNSGSKPATAARIYDYFLGGTFNFPADREAAKAMAERFPLTPALARNNRAFLRRAVRHLVASGVTQFLDIGSGIPTEGNVHEVAPDARVVYVDIDPVAVAEGMEILDGHDDAVSILGDLCDPQAILTHRSVQAMIDFDQPVGLLLLAVLHFVPDDRQAYDAVRQLIAALPAGSHLVVSHVSIDGQDIDQDDLAFVQDTYERRTTTPFRPRTRSQIERFFTGLDMVDPGVVWLPDWLPAPDDPTDFADDSQSSSALVGVGRRR